MQKFLDTTQVGKTLKAPDLNFQENIKSEKIKFSLFLLKRLSEYFEMNVIEWDFKRKAVLVYLLKWEVQINDHDIKIVLGEFLDKSEIRNMCNLVKKRLKMQNENDNKDDFNFSNQLRDFYENCRSQYFDVVKKQKTVV
jgi:hypothetical protein